MRWIPQLLCFFFGAVSVAAFAPFEINWIIFLSLGGLVYLSAGLSTKHSFKLGLFFGLGLYLFGVSWVYVSLSTYGGMPLWMGMVSVFGFAGLMAVFVALANSMTAFLAGSSVGRFLLFFPFSWVAFEWSKSWVFTGFPWLDLGYSQTGTWFDSWAPIGGIYQVTFVIAALCCLLVSIVRMRSWLFTIPCFVLVAFSWALSDIKWTSPYGTPVTIGIVQANIPIEGKWVEANRMAALAKYQSMSNELFIDTQPELIIWPETALPLYASQTDANFWRSMSPPQSNLLTGILDHDSGRSYNAALLSCASNREDVQLYRKRHLVPFGEYQPLKFLFGWVFEYLQLPMSDFEGWRGQQSLQCGQGINIGLSICYEDSFSNEYREHLNDATVLVNISEDAWFGDSIAPHQRRQMAQMRSRELGRPLVRSANSGPSLFIDHFGRLNGVTQQFKEAVLAQSVQPMQGSTPFMRIGSWVVWLSIAVLMGFLLRLAVIRRKEQT